MDAKTRSRYKVRWVYDSGVWKGLLATDSEPGSVYFGMLEVTEQGKFKARLEYLGKSRWLSSMKYVDYQPFESLVGAQTALLDAVLKEIPLPN